MRPATPSLALFLLAASQISGSTASLPFETDRIVKRSEPNPLRIDETGSARMVLIRKAVVASMTTRSQEVLVATSSTPTLLGRQTPIATPYESSLIPVDPNLTANSTLAPPALNASASPTPYVPPFVPAAVVTVTVVAPPKPTATLSSFQMFRQTLQADSPLLPFSATGIAAVCALHSLPLFRDPPNFPN